MQQSCIPIIRLILGAVTALAFTFSARADIWWNWSFAGEEGLFRTDGQSGDVLTTKTFTILDFHVTKSDLGNLLGSISGGEYYENQPTQGFEWNGALPNYFYRSGGALTNGASFNPVAPDPGDFYGFQPPTTISKFKDNTAYVDLASGILKLTPQVDTWWARPDATVGAKPKKMKGDNVYNSNGANQNVKIRSKGRRPFQFYYTTHTDSGIADTVSLRANSKNKKLKPSYYRTDQGSRKNITSSLKRGFALPNLNPTSEVKIQVVVKQKSSTRSRKGRCDLVATSASNATKTDRVMAKLVPKR